MDGGFGWTAKDALSLYATYTGLFYLTPLIGVWIADNFLGQRRCVMIGGVAMVAAQFVLALPNSVVGDSALYVFWAGFEQAGELMNIYSQQYTDSIIGSFTVPTEWFQSLNPFFIITLAPVIASLWVKMGSKEPSSPIKFTAALFFLAEAN